MSTSDRPRNTAQAWQLRRPERLLLIWCLLCVAFGFAMVLGSSRAVGGHVGTVDLLPLLIYTLSLVALHLTLVLSRFRGDQLLVCTAAFLSGFGVLAQYRMGAFSAAGTAHFAFPAGILVMLAVGVTLAQGRYHLLRRGIWLWAGLSLSLLAFVLVTGERFRGGVYAAGFITPTEILKITVVLFLAAFIDGHAKALARWGNPPVLPPVQDLLPLIGIWTLLAALLLLQRDLGMFVILSMALLVMLYSGTRRTGYLVYGLLTAIAIGYALLEVFRHGQRRILAWQDPFQDPTGGSWQTLQGLSGMYSGGLWGEGFGQGNPEYTPIAESDFIYAVIGEELGFLGCVILVVFFLVFFARSLRIAYQTRSSYGRSLCLGLTAVFVTQTFLNIGGVTKFIPLTGITLPFISQGGSSLLTAFASLGMLLAVSDGESAAARKKPAAKRTGTGRPGSTARATSGSTRGARRGAKRRRPEVG